MHGQAFDGTVRQRQNQGRAASVLFFIFFVNFFNFLYIGELPVNVNIIFMGLKLKKITRSHSISYSILIITNLSCTCCSLRDLKCRNILLGLD